MPAEQKFDALPFLDTNVLLYLISADATKAEQAERLIAKGGVVSAQVLNEFASVASRKARLSWPDIREVLGIVRKLCRVVAVDVDTHDDAIRIAERYRVSFYDALILAAAISARCPTIYTEDLHNGLVIDGSTVRSPFVA